MKLRYLNILILMVLFSASPAFGQEDLRTTFGPGVALGVPKIQPGTDLQRKIVDQTVFPLARCNDNTPAIFYFRPAARAADAHHWLIHLDGGGNCGSGLGCSERWFNIATGFNRNNMTSRDFPLGTSGRGIFERDARPFQPAPGEDPFLARNPENPIDGYNQVFVHYCSSDNWTGTAPDVVLNGIDFRPNSLGCKQYKISFLGRPIFDAVIDTLRRNGVAAMPYLRRNGDSQLLPDLDDAEFVILSGGSAGGAGVIYNLDHLRELLPPRIRVVGLSDSAFRPQAGMDLSQTYPCRSQAACTREAQNELNYSEGPFFIWGARTAGDRSCLLYHANDPAKCADSHHILTDHVTTPFFVRMALNDPNGLREYQDDGIFVAGSPDPDLSTSEHEPLSEDEFANAVRRDLLSLALVPQLAHERAGINFTPGVFGPHCSQHDVLKKTDDVYNTAIRHRGTQQMFDVILDWVRGTGPGILVGTNRNDSICPALQ